MKAVTAIAIVTFTAVLFSVGQAEARPRPKARARARFKHADKNQDGKISAREYIKEKQYTKQKRAEVNTAREEKMDTDGDGTVSRKESVAAHTKAYLKNRSEVSRAWEAKADTDGDGKVSAGELRVYHKSALDTDGDGSISSTERKSYWIKRKSRVNTAYEKKYDADEDGFISGDEAKEMLRDRLRIINTHGRAKVTTELEKEYDANEDGVIDREEAQAMLNEIRAKALLDGVRGAPPVDKEATVDALLRIGQLVQDFPEIVELDINPLMVLEQGQGAIAIDMRLVLGH